MRSDAQDYTLESVQQRVIVKTAVRPQLLKNGAFDGRREVYTDHALLDAINPPLSTRNPMPPTKPI